MESFREIPDKDLRELKWTKQRYGRKQAPMRFRWNPGHGNYELVPDTDTEKAILVALGEDTEQWWTADQLEEETGEEHGKISNALKLLLKEERIRRKTTGDKTDKLRYRLKAAGDKTESKEGGLSVR
jgi:hypothetical protein